MGWFPNACEPWGALSPFASSTTTVEVVAAEKAKKRAHAAAHLELLLLF